MSVNLAQIIIVTRQAILRCVQDPKASPERAAGYQARQFRSAVEHLALAASSTLVLLVGILQHFWNNQQRQTLLLLCTLIFASTLFNILAARRWYRWNAETTVSVSDVRILVWALGFCSALWGLLAAHCLKVGDPSQQILVVGSTAAMIATGAWMYAHLASAATAWVLGMCGAVALALFPAFPALLVMLPLYGGTLLISILLTSRVFLRGLIAEEEVAHQRQVVGLLLHDFEQNASDWLWETDAFGHLQHVSVRLASALKCSPEHLLGRSLVSLIESLEPPAEDRALGSFQHLAEKLKQQHPFRALSVAVMLDGERRWWSLTANPLFASDGGVNGWRGVGSDVTLLRQREFELTRLANVDALTGLANRHCFNHSLSSFFPDSLEQLPCVLFMVDLDNFKAINDSLGHLAGDELLVLVSRQLQVEVPSECLLARLGGDEFALVVPGPHDRASAALLGEQLQSALTGPFDLQGHQLIVRASIGAAFSPGDAQTSQQLLQAADMALYAAKASGRSTLRFFDARMDTDARNKSQLLADLHLAIERGELSLHYQPQIDFEQNRLVGFEALLRWQHPVRGMIGPGVFIPLAEDSGLIVAIGTWVLHQACLESAAWPSDLRVAVNVSALQFQRSDLRKSIHEALRCSDIAPCRLEIELTESALMQNSASAITLLHELRNDGVRVALDDFGTGFSSLAYLQTLPLDMLKIDRSFVMSLDVTGDAQSSEAIVQAVQSLAQAMGLQTTAEGVETVHQDQALRRLGCHIGQGYLYGRPMDAMRTRTFIDRYRSHGLNTAMVDANQSDVSSAAHRLSSAGK